MVRSLTWKTKWKKPKATRISSSLNPPTTMASSAGYPADPAVRPHVLSARRTPRPQKNTSLIIVLNRHRRVRLPRRGTMDTTARRPRPSPSADGWPPRSTNTTSPKAHSHKSFNHSFSTKHPGRKTLSRTARVPVADRHFCRSRMSVTAPRRAADWRRCSPRISARTRRCGRQNRLGRGDRRFRRWIRARRRW